jgi:hypothetical protein
MPVWVVGLLLVVVVGLEVWHEVVLTRALDRQRATGRVRRPVRWVIPVIIVLLGVWLVLKLIHA